MEILCGHLMEFNVLWFMSRVEGTTCLLETSCLQVMLPLERRDITVHVLKDLGKLENEDRAEDVAGLVI